MSTISAAELANPTSTSSTSQADKDSARFSKDLDDFLKIFIKQLQNQDPLEPMEASEFVNQIANMSQVEQSINGNKRLEELVKLNGVKDNSTLVSFIGKVVEVESQAVTLAEGENVAISYELEDPLPEHAFITVRALDGTIIFNGEGTNKAGRNNVAWDGTDNEGNTMPPGIYEVFVTVDKGAGDVTGIPTLVRGRVIGANLEATDPTLIVNGVEVPMDEVKFVGEETAIATL